MVKFQKFILLQTKYLKTECEIYNSYVEKHDELRFTVNPEIISILDLVQTISTGLAPSNYL